MNSCSVSFVDLTDYHEERLVGNERLKIEQHLHAGCSDCEVALRFLRRYSPALKKAAAPSEYQVSEPALTAAMAIARQSSMTTKHAGLATQIARLLFDSRLQAMPDGARGAGTSTYKVLYETEDYYLDIWQEQSESGRWYLFGTALSSGSGEVGPTDHVELIGKDGRSWATDGTLGEFQLADIPEGEFQLRLRLADSEVSIPDLRVGP